MKVYKKFYIFDAQQFQQSFDIIKMLLSLYLSSSLHSFI